MGSTSSPNAAEHTGVSSGLPTTDILYPIWCPERLIWRHGPWFGATALGTALIMVMLVLLRNMRKSRGQSRKKAENRKRRKEGKMENANTGKKVKKGHADVEWAGPAPLTEERGKELQQSAEVSSLSHASGCLDACPPHIAFDVVGIHEQTPEKKERTPSGRRREADPCCSTRRCGC